MAKQIFRKAVAFVIVSLFVITSMVPIIESNALGKNNSSEPLFYAREPPQSVDDHLMVKRSLTGLAPTSQTTRNSQYVLQSVQPEFHPSAPLGEVIFSQGYYLPTESWNFYTSDQGLGWYVQEDFFEVASDIGDIEWYGLDFNWNTYVPGNPTGMTFNIIFYEDNASAPGAEVANFANIEPTFEDTGLAYTSWGDLWYWQFELPSTVTLTAGWVGIQSTYCPDGSMFLWATGPDGNLNGRQNGASVGANFAYSLTAPNIQYDHDIVISSITAPVSGGVASITPIVKVKNAGLNTEYSVPVQFEIGKETISGTLENFEATDGGYIHYPKLPQPDVWAWGAPTSGPMAAYSGSNLWATNLAGAYPPSMWCILQTTPFVVPSGAMFNFWQWYYFEANYDCGNVKISNDGGATYTRITPVGGYPGTMPYNPFMVGQPAYNGQSGGWKQANFDLSAYVGQTCQIIFETASDSSVQYDGWYIDDVGFTSVSWATEYTQIATIASILPGEMINLSFPTWTPADMGLVENTHINYNSEVTNLFVDENINNDYKAKAFTLTYGYFDDVAVTQIISPVDGLAETQTPVVAIENHGQNDESVNVNMNIGKALYTTLLEEDFAGGVPPAGWTTDAPLHWMGSSTNYAGGTVPEAEFYYLNSDVGDFHLYTGVIDTTGFTALGLKFKEMVNDYNGDYTLKVQTSTDGGVTWSDVYVRPGGPYGPATTEITLTAANGVGSATLQISWTYSGNAFNINYWYIDDVWMGIIDTVDEYNDTVNVTIDPGTTINVTLPEWTPADIPLGITIDYLIDASVSMNVTDGNPADNEVAKMITLSYEHDVGVIVITEPHESTPKDDEDWLLYDNGVYANAFGSTTGQIYGANRFTPDEVGDYIGWNVDTIMWKHYGTESFSGTVRVYGAGSSTAPGAMLTSEPFSITGTGWFNITLSNPVTITGTDIWLGVEGTHASGQYPLECSAPGISLKTAFFSSDDVTWYDLPGLGYDVAWELRGHVASGGGPGGNWLPGTYPVEGIIQNLGVTYSETVIPVNTQITNDTGMVVYDETVIVAGLLAPGETAIATFPTITIPDVPEAEGDYRLIMKTKLVGDDHPNNDKKILTFIIQIGYPHIPPCTTATISGTLGKNGWFVSNVTVTLTATDGNNNWPGGVNHTYYKIDNGAWNEYFEPFIVSDDGYHTIYYYSVDKCIPPCVEEEKSSSFKIDQNAPSITMSVEKLGFRQWKFIATVSDEMSGPCLVECYIDDILLGNITEPGPYEWSWTGKGNHTVTGIAYDNAGNSAMNTVVFSLALNQYNHQRFLVLSFLGKIILRILSQFPMRSEFT